MYETRNQPVLATLRVSLKVNSTLFVPKMTGMIAKLVLPVNNLGFKQVLVIYIRREIHEEGKMLACPSNVVAVKVVLISAEAIDLVLYALFWFLIHTL